jgi:hypothetical protein
MNYGSDLSFPSNMQYSLDPKSLQQNREGEADSIQIVRQKIALHSTYLEGIFTNNKYPSDMFTEICDVTKLTRKQVRTWFKNRRTRNKLNTTVNNNNNNANNADESKSNVEKKV